VKWNGYGTNANGGTDTVGSVYGFAANGDEGHRVASYLLLGGQGVPESGSGVSRRLGLCVRPMSASLWPRTVHTCPVPCERNARVEEAEREATKQSGVKKGPWSELERCPKAFGEYGGVVVSVRGIGS